MTSGNRESRFEELRRRARERLNEVRENIEREKGASVPKDQKPSPDRLEDIFIPPKVTRPPEIVANPASIEEESARGKEAWEQRVTLPSDRDQAPTAEARPNRVAPTVTTTVAPVVQKRTLQSSTNKVNGSPLNHLLRKGNLRQAIIAQEVLGKPISLRTPQDGE